MILIGLTGSLGSGKSTVAGMFARQGAYVIDADAVVHEQLRPTGKAYKKVVKTFGKDILSGKDIDRRKLADIVFRNEHKLKQLTSIVHPIAFKEVQARIKSLKRDAKIFMIVVDAPLLIEAGWHRWMDYIVVVKASKEVQVSRLMTQRKMTRPEILRRMKSQLPIKQKINMADIVIDNNKGLKEIEKQTRMIVERLLLRSS